MTSRSQVSVSSWFTTLVGAALLLGLGFGAGLVAGVVTEDPGLVWAHMSGDSVEAPLPAVAAQGGHPKEPDRRETAVPSNVLLSGFSVQVGAFNEAGQAEALRAELVSQGFAAYVHESGGTHRVRVGPVEERPEADALARALADQQLPTWVLREGE